MTNEPVGLMVPTGVSWKRKRTRAAPSDRSPSRWQRGRSPLSTGCPGPFHAQPPVQPDLRRRPPQLLLLCHVGCWTEQQLTPDRGDVNHEPWRRRYCGEELGYITSQLREMFAARPGRRESTAGLLGPPAVICRFCPVRAADFYRVTEKFGPWPTCTPWFRGMDHPTWRHEILSAPASAADAVLPLRR
jgi:hypothetical protein